ncbi:kelch-like protein 34 [Hemiscyllium ocellatum]|uniref:kelch-like protein 34 n=1 Tax=Hemiscyllium ocellatum TaxID=170820 RepID=UPI002966C3F2|nr:kelch-like protein 34 [Hemiscyllium ocellatum]
MSSGEQAASYFLALSPTHGESVLSRYQSLRQERLLCDVVLVAEGSEFAAHRSLLACASDYFRGMFREYTRESKAGVVHLPAVSAGGLRRVLDFIYNACLPLSPDSLPQTLETARYLQVPGAVQLCSRYLVSSLSPGGCCRAANVAARFALPDAQRQAERYIASRLRRLLLQEGAEASGLLELNGDSLRAVLECDAELDGVPEGELLRLLLAWLGRDERRWEAHARRLLPALRYCLLAPAELGRLRAEPRLDPAARRLVSAALDYHRDEAAQPARQSRQSTLRGRRRQLLAVGGLLLQPPPPPPPGGPGDGAVDRLWALTAGTGEWRPLGRCPRLQHHCVCVLAGFLFVLGGEELGHGASVTARVRRYDPRFGRWSPVSAMASPRAQFACCVLGGRILALGGRGGSSSSRSPPPAGASLPTAELYDPSSGAWQAAPPLPVAVHGHACAVHQEGGTVYVTGGRHGGQAESSPDMFSYREEGTAAGGGEWASCPPMSIARFGHQMAAVGQRLYSFVGTYEPFCDIECYEPRLRQWRRLRPLLGFDRSCYGLAVLGARVYLVGGKRWHGSREVAAPDAVLYDTRTDSWSEAGELPLPLCGTQCAVLQLLDPPPPGQEPDAGEPPW